jgi:hypothetical protein
MKPIRIALALLAVASSAAAAQKTDIPNPLIAAPTPDPRIGLKAGLQDAGTAIWNMKLVAHVPQPQGFAGVTNSDLAFSGSNVIQGNYNGFQIWNVANPAAPVLRVGKICPASQSDVSVYRNLLFVSAEAPSARLDCGTVAPRDPVSAERIRGLRIFDITDIDNPKYIANVQTCRGSHTHTVVDDPKDKNNVYVYISGTSGIRPSEELARCNSNPWDPNNSNFRIEVIKVPLAHPEQAAVVTSPRIFADPTSNADNGLLYIQAHGASPADTARLRAQAQFDTARSRLAPVDFTSATDSTRCRMQVDSLATVYRVQVNAGRGGRGGGRGAAPVSMCGPSVLAGRGGRGGGGRGGNANGPVTREDSAAASFNAAVQALARPMSSRDSVSYRQRVDALARQYGVASPFAPRALTQCHDITVYPGVGLAGGACAGMGLLLDISNTPNPKRITAVADSNFSFWHSATFSNDGSMVLFSDEWGGGGAAYCRAEDPMNWGADAIFTIDRASKKMTFQNYYKMPAPQTAQENCVAHNGNLIPIPGRTIMVQAWYQGGVSVFEWTDPKHPHELAFFDRGPNDSTRLMGGGVWSVYYYNGNLYSSEMQRGLDVLQLTPSGAITQNELDAANTVHLDFLNVQDQPKYVWPASFALSKAYTDQLERWKGLSSAQVSAVRSAIADAEGKSGAARKSALTSLSAKVRGYRAGSSDKARIDLLAKSLTDLASK